MTQKSRLEEMGEDVNADTKGATLRTGGTARKAAASSADSERGGG